MNDIVDKNNDGSILFKFAIFIKTPPPLGEKTIRSLKNKCPTKYKVKYKIKNIRIYFLLFTRYSKNVFFCKIQNGKR